MVPSSILGGVTIFKKEIILETSNLVPRSNNALPLYKNDKVLITGEIPDNPVVNYVGEMINNYMNNKQTYRIDKVVSMGKPPDTRFCIKICGWNWDCRNIKKLKILIILIIQSNLTNLKFSILKI